MIRNILDDALKMPMSRREFLGQIGAVLLALIGVTAIMHAVGGFRHAGSTSGSVAARGGYGSMPYGGATESRG